MEAEAPAEAAAEATNQSEKYVIAEAPAEEVAEAGLAKILAAFAVCQVSNHARAAAPLEPFVLVPVSVCLFSARLLLMYSGRCPLLPFFIRRCLVPGSFGN